MHEEIYERLQDLLVPNRLSHAEQRALLAAAGKPAGWDNPEMAVYDREEETPSQP